MPELSVLVVDDDVDNATNVCDILSEFGYDVLAAHDGNTALSLVKEKLFDVALLDFKMPDMDGATLYGHIRKIQPELVAIMVTAYAGSDGVERAMDAGVWQVLKKPLHVPDLLDKIGLVLQQPAILIVDDDEAFCSSLWDVLRERNYRVGIAHTDIEAIEQCQSKKFDLVLLDLNLGDQTCQGVLKNLAASSTQGSPHTIIITGQKEDVDTELTEETESVFFKPLAIDKLLKKIQSLLPDQALNSDR